MSTAFISPEGQFSLQLEISMESLTATPNSLNSPNHLQNVNISTSTSISSGFNLSTNSNLTSTSSTSTSTSSTSPGLTTNSPISSFPISSNLSSILPIGAPTQISLVQVRYENLSNKKYKSPILTSPIISTTKDPTSTEISEKSSENSSFDVISDHDNIHNHNDEILNTKSLSPILPISYENKRLDDDGMMATLFGSNSTSSNSSLRKRKPKNNITRTNSSFVSKIINHENFTKIITNVTGSDTYLFANIGRTFCWTDLKNSPQEPLSKIAFAKAFPTCHDVNQLTRAIDHLDVIIGFSSGDTFWYDPIKQKYLRINKGGAITSSPVTHIRWFPGSENLFMASYGDGSMVIYDKERIDYPFTPSEKETFNDMDSTIPLELKNSSFEQTKNIFHVTKPSGNAKQISKQNPVSHWRVSKKSITDFAFSPDCEHIAVVSQDGCLRIINFLKEKLLDTFSSYFGSLNCVAWSPDGRYIITGGQDDLVTIWSFQSSLPSSTFSPDYQKRIIARCHGHTSWVTGVAFDSWKCDEKNYRFGSVGEDAKLLLWDFSVQALHKPKNSNSNLGKRDSYQITITNSLPDLNNLNRSTSPIGGLSLRREITHNSFRTAQIISPHFHPVCSKNDVAILQPVVVRQIDHEPLKSIIFTQDGIITTCSRGHIKCWSRPKRE